MPHFLPTLVDKTTKYFYLGVMLCSFPVLVMAAPLLQRGTDQQHSMNQGSSQTTNASENNETANVGLVNYELFKQIEAMQNEIQILRGTLEEQNYEIERLKKAEKDRYADLDRRINDIQAQNMQGSGVMSSAAPIVGDDALLLTQGSMDEDQRTYLSAKQKVDSKEYNAAIAEFTLYLEFFPQGKYVPQAHYWLGELYMALAIPEYENAQKHFETVVKNYPKHAKVPDCLYKIGLIQKAQNKKDLAKLSFQKLLNDFPKSATSSLAKTQLEGL